LAESLDRVVIDALVALGFGASLISIFARLGGGIFTKGADVGGDLVGKVEAGIPEDDPRNPATIADNVGDNVGDCAGMAADLFETYAVTVVATMVLAAIFFAGQPCSRDDVYPLAIGAACVVTSIIGTFFVKLGANQSIMGALYKGFIATGRAVARSPIGHLTGVRRLGRRSARSPAWTFTGTNLFSAAWSALSSRLLIVVITEYYTGTNKRPVNLDRPGLGHRPRHQRHPGPRGVAGIDGAAGDRHHRRHHRRPTSSPACSASPSRSPPCWRSPA
jgi:K(+)-stimulated pyrophosphate-energized sodium pump